MVNTLEILVIVVAVIGLLVSFTRAFSPLRAADEIGRVGNWFAHEDDLAPEERRDANENDPPIPHRPLRGRG
ncbi:MAG TPA: hypothetical protein VG405_08840 [Solirubrobacteraceae bacterium]|jgi:hypothetical protein|nr:hypothetical protein [Solirubrobacteraceae bacterium]